MGNAEPVRSEPENQAGAGLHPQKVFASNTRVCVEEPLREGEIALNLGSGKCLWPGWVNVDQAGADVHADLLALPFPDNHADRIASIHVLEHFYFWDAPRFLDECKRTLKPGGTITLELPCMDSVFGYIADCVNKNKAPSATFSWLALWGDPAYRNPGMCHRWGYFKSDMRKLLSAAGFENIQEASARYHFPQRDMRFTAQKGAS